MVGTLESSPKILFHREFDRDISFAVVDEAAERLAVAYIDFSIEIMAINGDNQVVGPLRHRSVIRAMMFSPDGHILASGSDDGTLRLWDVASRTVELAALAWEPGRPHSIPAGRRRRGHGLQRWGCSHLADSVRAGRCPGIETAGPAAERPRRIKKESAGADKF